MAYATVDVGVRIDPRWAEIPSRYRSAAKAMYVDAVLYSAEMLTDGNVNRAVLGAIASENGLHRYKKVVDSLLEAGLFATTKTGVSISGWQDFHYSRAEVTAIRKREADKKRAQREKARKPAQGQMQIPDVPLASPGDVPRDNAGDSRARARPRDSAADTDEVQDLPGKPSDPAAAASETDPPRETRIREVVEQLPGADHRTIDQVEPLARQITAATFEHLVGQVLERRNVRNRTGLLVELLRTTIEGQRRITAIAAATVNGHATLEPTEASLRLHVPALAHLDDDQAFASIDTLLDARNVHGDERIRLTDLAANILQTSRANSTTAETGATL